MPPNPLRATWNYLRGADLQDVERKVVQGPRTAAASVSPAVPDGTSYTYAWMQGGVFSTTDGYYSDGNSAVFACLMALSLAHIEPPLRVLRRTTAEDEPAWLEASPLQSLLDDPNPWHDALELWFWTQYARHCDGNAYLRKVRTGNELTGNVVELWPISPRLLRPVTESGSSNFIDYYEYTYAAGKKERIETENVVHFRIGVDDRDMRLGLSPIKRLIREIASDDEATKFADTLLANYGVPGLVVTAPQDAPTLTEDQANAIKTRLTESFTNGNRGAVTVLTGGADVHQFGFNPEQLNLEVLHNVPETRICAVMGVPPAVAGLGVGLAQTSNFASMKQVRENFTEVTLVPTWRLDAAKLNKQLKPDFTNERNVWIQHDLSNVRALQEDQDAKYRRLALGVAGQWIRPSEARVQVGMPADDELDAIWLAKIQGASSSSGPAALPEQQPKTVGDLEHKQVEVDVDTLAATYQRIVDALEPGLERRLDGYFDGQRRRVNRALVNG